VQSPIHQLQPSVASLGQMRIVRDHQKRNAALGVQAVQRQRHITAGSLAGTHSSDMIGTLRSPSKREQL
jgi:hypothetical protein